MAFLASLWLPILLSAVAVFVVSSILHMLLPIHRGDHGKLPGEAEVLEAMRSQGVTPGSYVFPCPGSMKDMGTPEMVAKYEKGPVGFLTVVPTGAPRMGKSLVLWFVYSLVVSYCVAYIAAIALKAGADFTTILRLTATAATLGYAVSAVQDSIWKGQRWGITMKFVLDGLIYGVVTGLVFALLWPCGS